MAQRQKLELKLSDVDDIRFRGALKGYMVKIDEDKYIMGNDDLGIKVSGRNPKEAAELLKEEFITLANDIIYKSKYAALSERERKKFNIINSICDII